MAAQSRDFLADLMTKQETAKALHSSIRTLDRWHTERTGPPRFKLGGQVFYSRADLNAYVAQQKEATQLR